MTKRGAAYPTELRERVVALVDGGARTHAEVASLMSVGIASVRRWLRREREGSLSPLPHGGGRPLALDNDDEAALRVLVEEKRDRTIAELTALLMTKRKRVFSTSSVGRALQRLDLVLKKRASPPASASERTSKKHGESSSKRSSTSTLRAATSSMRRGPILR